MALTNTTRFICLFHDPDRGRAAVDALATAGFPRETIVVLGSSKDRDNTYGTGAVESLGAPERDIQRLHEGLERGGVIVSLEAPESRSDEIEGIFHRYSADKIDEADLRGREGFGTPPVQAQRPAVAVESAVVPVVEEELLVGKREVDRGGVRVFQRIVEEPVAETMNLREENVVIDRRPVDRAVTNADLAAAEQTIELTETAEVPVVTKTARVVEEVRVGLQESSRTQTVEDTVRHTEVDLEQVPGSAPRTQGYDGQRNSNAQGTGKV